MPKQTVHPYNAQAGRHNPDQRCTEFIKGGVDAPEDNLEPKEAVVNDVTRPPQIHHNACCREKKKQSRNTGKREGWLVVFRTLISPASLFTPTFLGVRHAGVR